MTEVPYVRPGVTRRQVKHQVSLRIRNIRRCYQGYRVKPGALTAISTPRSVELGWDAPGAQSVTLELSHAQARELKLWLNQLPALRRRPTDEG